MSTLGVASTPLGGWSGEGILAAFAGLGYDSIVALPLLAAAWLARAGRTARVRASTVLGLLAAMCLAASTLGPAHGPSWGLLNPGSSRPTLDRPMIDMPDRARRSPTSSVSR